MPTIKDVARIAGVSPATVSRVIRGESNVSDNKRELVLSAIESMQFKPNALARQLRTQQTKTVIVIVPHIANTFFAEIIGGIERTAISLGYQVLLADMQNDPKVELHYLHGLASKQADGVISLSANVALSLMEQVAGQFPVVVACQYLEDTELCNVTIDNIEAAKTMMNHLIGLGHTRIGHITCHSDMLLYRDRLNGYYQALADSGIPIDLELVQYARHSSIQSGYEQMCRLLDQKKQVTAVFAAGDVMAIGAIKALKDHGKRVPEDCAVVGFDDIEISGIYTPSLTTIRQPKAKMGTLAMEILAKLMEGKEPERRQVLLDYELVVRESCGAKAAGNYSNAKKEPE